MLDLWVECLPVPEFFADALTDKHPLEPEALFQEPKQSKTASACFLREIAALANERL